VRPFLFNLFRDRAIIGLPAVVRYPLAGLISWRREKTARANYDRLGGGSPLLPETQAQARALEAALSAQAPGIEARVFIAMRYWAPLSTETAKAVAAFEPDEIVLAPLYPQFSTTTTASSLAAWTAAYAGKGRTRTICCYPTDPGLAEAHAEAIRDIWETAGKTAGLRLLFSAHGLPQKVVDAGDPYRAQVEATAAAVAAKLPELVDWRVCFQSRVGPMKWLTPATEDEIRRAGAEGKGVLVSPIAFVSEHVETLVELDHDYAELARAVGCAPYLRARTPGVRRAFVDSLAQGALAAVERADPVGPIGPWRCPAAHGQCALRRQAA
jgi:ferrochelatase